MRRRLAAGLSVCLTACMPTPDSYKIPPQHEPVGISATAGFREYVGSGNQGAEAYYVKDIQGLEGKDMRWTHVEPEFRFFVTSVDGRRFRLDFSVHDVTFKDTGPVTLVFQVNGHELTRVRYDKPGHKIFEMPVPPEWLKVGVENRVVVRVLNPWQASEPDVRLGFVLHGAGFVH